MGHAPKFLLFTLLVVCPFAGASDGCARTILSEHFNLLRPQILTKVVGGVPRIVVLIPETHAKGKRTRQITEELMGRFPLVGIENMPDGFGGYFIGKISGWGRNFLKMVFRLEESNIHITDPSNIKAMLLSFQLPELIRVIELRSGRPIASLSDQELLAISGSLHGSEPITGTELLMALRPDSPLLVGNATFLRKVVDIEERYRPTWAARLHGGMIMICFCVAMPWMYARDLYPALRGTSADAIIGNTSGFFMAEALLHMLLGHFSVHFRWMPWLTPVSELASQSRDWNMVANIERAFQDNPEAREMVTVTGGGHVPGIYHRLRSLGWRAMSVEEYGASPE